MGHWYLDERFWVETYPFMFSQQRLEGADLEVEQALALAGSSRPRVCDLCCGPGRHAVALARRGLRVTAVDASEYLLGAARERARCEGVDVEWCHQDMREHRRPGAYDLVVNLFTSFGYFADEADDLRVLRNVRESLAESGVLLMELAGKEWLAENFVATSSSESADGALLIERRRVVDGWSAVENRWTLISDGRVRTFEFRHTVYSGRELKERLLGAGFNVVSLFGDLAGNPYAPGAARLVVRAQR